MPKRDRLYLRHMRAYAERARGLVEGRRREDLDRDEALRFALAYLLQTIGEAASHVSKRTRLAHPEISWQAIIGMRHRIVHYYVNLDEQVVWSTATEDLVPPLEALRRILDDG
jgi:uncharacterized protein with HEPN domain